MGLDSHAASIEKQASNTGNNQLWNGNRLIPSDKVRHVVTTRIKGLLK